MTFSAENMGAKRPIDPVSQVQRSALLQPLFSSARISFSQCLYHSTAQRLFLIVSASSLCDRNLARAVLTDLSPTFVCWPGLRQREVNLAVIDGFLGEATSRQPNLLHRRRPRGNQGKATVQQADPGSFGGVCTSKVLSKLPGSCCRKVVSDRSRATFHIQQVAWERGACPRDRRADQGALS